MKSFKKLLSSSFFLKGKISFKQAKYEIGNKFLFFWIKGIYLKINKEEEVPFFLGEPENARALKVYLKNLFIFLCKNTNFKKTKEKRISRKRFMGFLFFCAKTFCFENIFFCKRRVIMKKQRIGKSFFFEKVSWVFLFENIWTKKPHNFYYGKKFVLKTFCRENLFWTKRFFF